MQNGDIAKEFFKDFNEVYSKEGGIIFSESSLKTSLLNDLKARYKNYLD